jgi:acyl carrier protein
MDNSQVIQKMQEIFRDVLDNEDIVLTETTVAKDIEEWDSLSHLQLVVAIEKSFKIKFTTPEITAWKNVSDMAKNVVAKGV